jgi:NAD(P)-dependent dehydrogenase (short-subunit alcohol dehydrogenase family)
MGTQGFERFAGQVAVVTGGASGIGRALAVRAQQLHMNVVVADIEAEPLHATARELGVEPFQVDVRDPDAVEALAGFVFERFGSCDLLFNNAGVAGRGRIDEQTLDDWNWIIDVNIRGVVHVIRAFLPRMQASAQGGHIVNTASIGGLTAIVSGPYTASKYAVVGISETLRHELAGSSVGVSVLCPGFVRTNLGTSDRNRPPESVASTPGSRTSGFGLLAGMKPLVLDPEQVAEQVFSAVADGEFWIVTDPSILTAVPRYDELRAIAETRHNA